MDFDRFLREVCPPLGLDWRKYRRRAARHRVQRRMWELNLQDYGSFLERLRTDPEEAAGLADLMRVTVSRFFRDWGCWSAMVEKVLPVILSGKTTDNAFRVWSAGCCGGEEPYSMAICWLAYLHPLFHGLAIDILATDIDDSSMARASAGLYSSASLREVPRDILGMWFSKRDGMWLVDGRVKELVRFRKHNLMKDPPPSGLDLVLCRYLSFTYYRGVRLLTAGTRLHESLLPGGVLMTGRSEILDDPLIRYFEPWPAVRCAYRAFSRERKEESTNM